MRQRGQVLRLKSKGRDGKALWAYRYRFAGRGSRRPQRGGFATRSEAQDALNRVLDELGRGRGLLARITFAELAEKYLAQHEVDPVTLAKLRWLLSKSVAALGGRRVVDLRSDELAAWRMTVPEGHRFEATQALRQVLARAVAWKIIDSNPATIGVENPQRRRKEMRPFESWAEIEAVAARLGPVYGPMIVFAAATGLRPGEWIALERRDVDRGARVVHVRRSFSYGRLKRAKTEASLRAVPLQAIALETLDRLPARLETPLLFPSPRGGYLDLHNFRARAWKRAQLAAGIEPPRRIYDLRHTFATFALRAGISTFDLCRYMGTSLTMIDRHYGHLARDAREHAFGLLDAHAAGDAASLAEWTPGGRRARSASSERPTKAGSLQGSSKKPTRGLEPRTPSLRERQVRDARPLVGTRGCISRWKTRGS
jgi:integrase